MDSLQATAVQCSCVVFLWLFMFGCVVAGGKVSGNCGVAMVVHGLGGRWYVVRCDGCFCSCGNAGDAMAIMSVV